MWFLWETHGNPVHPYYNHIFKSPLGAISDYKDLHYHPKTALDRLTLPFRFSIDPLIVGEIVFRDFRIVTLYVLLPIAALVSLITPRHPGDALSAPGPTRWLLAAITLSYAAWAWMFCIYRYAVPIEMLAPLGIVLALGLLPLSPKLRWSAAVLILAVLQATTVLGHLGTVGLGKSCGRIQHARDP